jgi:hypothetical protein
MKYLSGIEFKIFLTFFIIYSLFAHWVGWNEQSRLLQAIAIVDVWKLDITEYANFTGDRSYFNGKYYSDKAPGISFLLSPIYLFSKFVTNDKYSPNLENKIVIPDIQFNTTVYTDLSEGSVVHLTRILGIIFLSSLPGALIIILIYKILFENLNDRKIAMIVSFIFGVGTFLFSYSSTLFGNIFSLFLVLLSFYLILFKQGTTNLEFLVGGILLGISVIFDYLTVFISLISLVVLSFLYAILREKFKSYKIILIGFIFGMIILPIYNYVAFGNVLTFSWYYIDPDIFPCKYGQTYLESCQQKFEPSVFQMQVFQPQQLNQIAILLFSAYKGLFFYSTFLLFSFLGFRYLFKKNWLLSVWVLSIFFSYLTFNSIYSWFGGSSFGSRYLIYTLPFLTIPTAYFIKYNKNNFLRYAFLVSVIIAIFHIILGNSDNWEGLDFEYFPNEIKVRIEWYKNTFYLKSFWRLNPLYQHYLPAFLDNGPRSRILEYLLVGEIPDIRDFKPMPVREIKLFTIEPSGILTLQVPFLIIPILLSVALLIWRKELSNFRILNLRLDIFLLLIIFLLFLSRIEFKYITFGKGWMPQGINETVRWSSKSGEIYIFSPIEREVMLNISLLTYREKTLELHLNGNLINTYISPESILEIVRLKKGENKLLLLSKEDCEIPLYVENQMKCSNVVECMKMNISIFNISFDARCLSFGIVNISIVPIDTLLTKNVSIFYGSGFYPQEKYGRWMSSSSIIYLIRQMNYSKLSLEVESFKQPRKLFIEIDGKYYVFDIPAEKPQKISLILTPANITQIKLETYPACEVSGKGDNRCLSVFLRNFSLESLNNIEYFNFFEEEKYNEIKFRWFSTISKVYVLSNETTLSLIKLNAWTIPNQTRILKIYVNDMMIREYNVSEEIKPIYLPLVLRKGINEILFVLDECGYVANDIRCLGAAISEIQKEEIDIKNIEKISKGFYGLERAYGSYFRWMSSEGEIPLFSSQNSSVKLYTKVGWTYFSDRNLNITLNNKLIFAEKIAKNGKEFSITLNLLEGWNKLKFASTCDVPARLEFSEDKRCLSLGFVNLSLLPSS